MARCASMISPTDDAGKIELHGQRLGEQAGVALRDARAAAGADLDLDDALGFQRSQRIARDDAADAEPRRPDPFRCRGNRPGEAPWRTARRAPGRRSASTWSRCGRERPSARRSSWRDEAACKASRWSRLLTGSGRKSSNDHKDDIFALPPVNPSTAGVSPRLRVAGRGVPPLIALLGLPRDRAPAAPTGRRLSALRLAARVSVDDLPVRLRVARRRAKHACTTHASLGRATSIALRDHRLRELCAATVRRALTPCAARKLAPCSSPSSTSSKPPACR